MLFLAVRSLPSLVFSYPVVTLTEKKTQEFIRYLHQRSRKKEKISLSLHYSNLLFVPATCLGKSVIYN